LQGGADLIIMRHPKSLEAVRNAIQGLAGS
jgi:hypothetical protein